MVLMRSELPVSLDPVHRCSVVDEHGLGARLTFALLEADLSKTIEFIQSAICFREFGHYHQ